MERRSWLTSCHFLFFKEHTTMDSLQNTFTEMPLEEYFKRLEIVEDGQQQEAKQNLQQQFGPLPKIITKDLGYRYAFYTPPPTVEIEEYRVKCTSLGYTKSDMTHTDQYFLKQVSCTYRNVTRGLSPDALATKQMIDSVSAASISEDVKGKLISELVLGHITEAQWRGIEQYHAVKRQQAQAQAEMERQQAQAQAEMERQQAQAQAEMERRLDIFKNCLLYTSPSPRDS